MRESVLEAGVWAGLRCDIPHCHCQEPVLWLLLDVEELHV